MTRIVVLGVLVMVAGAVVFLSPGQPLGSTAAQPASDPFLITPGVGIGKVKVGMPIGTVITILGAPKNICRGRGEGNINVYAWVAMTDQCLPLASGTGLLVYTNPAGTVTHVTAYKDARYHLDNGLRVGSAESLIRDRMRSDPVIAMGLDGPAIIQYSALGITFTDYSIAVYTPGTCQGLC